MSRKPTIRWPNIHEWALFGFFAMTFYLLKMVRDNPALLGVPSFMQFASQLAGGGLLLAAAWLYSSSKAPKGDAAPEVKVVNEPGDPIPTTTNDEPMP